VGLRRLRSRLPVSVAADRSKSKLYGVVFRAWVARLLVDRLLVDRLLVDRAWVAGAVLAVSAQRIGG
jgi:hypothetical protein